MRAEPNKPSKKPKRKTHQQEFVSLLKRMRVSFLVRKQEDRSTYIVVYGKLGKEHQLDPDYSFSFDAKGRLVSC